jgi:hypothetical protein
MRKDINIVLTCVDQDSENSHIGVITKVNNPIEEVVMRVMAALQEHFDADIIFKDSDLEACIVGLQNFEGVTEMVVKVEDYRQTIRFQETWFY